MADGAYQKAVDLLARRPHFEREIQHKLRDRGFESSDIDEALSRLRRIGFLDDDGCARLFVRSKLRRSPVGRRRLAADLRRRGADGGSIDRALADPELDADLDLARRAAERWATRGGEEKAALMRHLDRRGFSKSDILTVAGEQIPVESPP